MIDIIFTVCQLIDPSICIPVRLKHAYDDNNLTECYSRAQMEAAKYLRNHQGWYITSYGCIRSDAENL